MAIFYVNNSSTFVTSSITGGVQVVNMVSGSANVGGAPATYPLRSRQLIRK